MTAQPKLKRHDSHKKAKLTTAWRKPRGLQSKMRLKKRGYGACATSPGQCSAVATRGKVDGLQPVLISTPEQLKKIDVKKECAIIASVGKRKKELILTAAKAEGITFLNVKNVDAALTGIATSLTDRKKTQEARAAKKAEDEKAAKKKTVEDTVKEKESAAKKETAALSEEEKKAAAAEEKKERDKVYHQDL